MTTSELRQVLDPDGNLVGDPPLPMGEVRRLYAAMVEARHFDRRCTALAERKELATFAPFQGQEAAQIGTAAALRRDDWMVASYRDAAAMWLHGYPWENLIAARMGLEQGGCPPEGVPVLPPSITVGAHMLHAVGLAWAAKLRDEDRVAVTYFGDGATSEGDFHEAMNFAAVLQAPTVFVCQNNGWAISVPLERQTASETIAQKAGAYGMPGVRVDGNDLLACYAAAAEAVDRARGGGGPTLIEAVTYRVREHVTGHDDPDRYRDDEEAGRWRRRDPLERVRLHLAAQAEWDAGWQAELEAAAAAAVDDAVARAAALPAPTAADMFSGMFAELPPHLAEQAGLLARDRGEAPSPA